MTERWTTQIEEAKRVEGEIDHGGERMNKAETADRRWRGPA